MLIKRLHKHLKLYYLHISYTSVHSAYRHFACIPALYVPADVKYRSSNASIIHRSAVLLSNHPQTSFSTPCIYRQRLNCWVLISASLKKNSPPCKTCSIFHPGVHTLVVLVSRVLRYVLTIAGFLNTHPWKDHMDKNLCFNEEDQIWCNRHTVTKINIKHPSVKVKEMQRKQIKSFIVLFTIKCVDNIINNNKVI